MRPLDDYVKDQLDKHLKQIEEKLNSDVMSIISPIVGGVDRRVKDALERINNRKTSLAIVLDTPGGIVEVVERIVNAIRNFYQEVIFVIPDRAMSAGTIFALSGDRILMDYFSCLGPIDPQIEKEGNLVPALSYLNQFERLNEKAEKGELTSAEYALLSKLDLGELDRFEQARELSIELLKKWLSNYKFKNWSQTMSRGIPVTQEMKEKRAGEVAKALSDAKRWHSHGRSINMQTLINEINLQIEDFSSIKDLGHSIWEYFDLLRDYMNREKLFYFIHTRGYF